MNPEIKAKWVAALRNPFYKQIQGQLVKFDVDGNVRGMCCLGVLCHLHAMEHGITFQNPAQCYLGHSGPPPIEVLDWAGLVLGDDVKIGRRRADLMAHNDEYGHTFKQIADAIEAQL